MINRIQHERVVELSLNRPERRNALNAAMCRALVEELEAADRDPGVGAILLTGRGAAFCSGMDLQEAVRTGSDDLAQLHERLFTAVRWMRKPIVAAVHGGALAGGMGLVANAHIVVASHAARFGLTEIRVGLWPILIYRACALALGERRATELSLTGRIFTAEEALHMGLATELAEHPDVRAKEIADSLSRHSATAMSAGLEYVERIGGVSWEEAARIGQSMRADLMADADFEEGVKAFLEKRNPVWPSIGR